MSYKKVLLLFPDYKGGHFGALRPPAGLGYICETLKASNVEYDFLDMAAGATEEDLKDKLSTFKPDLVGMSLMSFMYRRSYEIARMIKEMAPGVHIVAGGPHVSTLRERVLEECSEIDFGVVLEGEETIVELCQGKEPSEIGGLIRREDGKAVFNGERPFISDLDAVPFPRYDGFPLGNYVTEEIGIVSSRGCPYACIYCPVKAAIGRRWRRRSAQSIISEIEYWHQKGYRQFSMLDDNFSLSRKRVMEICDELKRRKFEGIELNCNNGIRADRVDREVLTAMKEAGFKYLAFGVEAGNNKVLKNIKKGENMEVVETAIRDAIDLGFKVTLFFLVGSPGETLDDIQDSINLALKYPVFDARFYNLIPFPQSELYTWVEQNDMFTVNPENYLNSSSQWDYLPVFETSDMDKAKREQALKIVRDVRKKVRYNSMKASLEPKLGPVASLVAKIYVNDRVQDKLMKSGALRRNLKKAFMKVAR